MGKLLISLVAGLVVDVVFGVLVAQNFYEYRMTQNEQEMSPLVNQDGVATSH